MGPDVVGYKQWVCEKAVCSVDAVQTASGIPGDRMEEDAMF